METIALYPIFVKKGKHTLEHVKLFSKKTQKKERAAQIQALSKLPRKKLVRATVIGVIENNVIKFGVAFTSHKDNYVKHIGRKIAYNRALTFPIRIIKLEENNKFTIKQALQQAQALINALELKLVPMQSPSRQNYSIPLTIDKGV